MATGSVFVSSVQKELQARYIEKAGSGILDMIGLCRAADLPDPEFRQDGGMFVQTLRRNVLTSKKMDELGLSDRQRIAVVRVIEHGLLTNAGYQELTGASRTTARRDLEDLINKGVLRRRGQGRGAHYVLSAQVVGNGPIEPLNAP